MSGKKSTSPLPFKVFFRKAKRLNVQKSYKIFRNKFAFYTCASDTKGNSSAKVHSSSCVWNWLFKLFAKQMNAKILKSPAQTFPFCLNHFRCCFRCRGCDIGTYICWQLAGTPTRRISDSGPSTSRKPKTGCCKSSTRNIATPASTSARCRPHPTWVTTFTWMSLVSRGNSITNLKRVLKIEEQRC